MSLWANQCVCFRSARALITVLCTRGSFSWVQHTVPAPNTWRRCTNCRYFLKSALIMECMWKSDRATVTSLGCLCTVTARSAQWAGFLVLRCKEAFLFFTIKTLHGMELNNWVKQKTKPIPCSKEGIGYFKVGMDLILEPASCSHLRNCTF